MLYGYLAITANVPRVCELLMINLIRMSKRCKLQKEYYQQFGNYKGDGKYCDKYVSWLEEQILSLRMHNVMVELSAAFYITDFCKCKCGENVSPSQVDTINQILYDDNREKIVGFECWKCGEWIAFPKTCR